MKKKFEEILESHGIFGEDVESILYAVSDMLTFVADKTKQEEPYATTSISNLEKAAYEIFSIASDMSE